MPKTKSRMIFCDLDGVLCDFDDGILRVFKKDVSLIATNKFWHGLAKYKSPEGHGFYDTLKWMKNGPNLWEMIKDLQPTILTGLPRGNWAEKQKRKWCKENLGEHVPVICCWSKEKHLHSGVGRILIDDRLSLKDKWVKRGGMFVHYTEARPSIEHLKVVLVKHFENFTRDETATTSSIASSVEKGGKCGEKIEEPRVLALLRRGSGVKDKQIKEVSVEEEEEGRLREEVIVASN